MRFSLPVCVALLAAAPVALLGAEVSFNRDVRPILSDKCYHCHGPDEQNRKGELRLDTAAGAAKVLKADKPLASELFHRITTKDPEQQMPPQESNFTKRLTEPEIAILKKWLESGAKYDKHWAFESPVQVALPDVADPVWKEKPLDRFIYSRLMEAKLKPSAPADKVTLMRRVSLDLTGLLPTPAEVEAYLKDTHPQAYEHLVDRLLNSPRYGERMALAWMDLARYGDSSVYHADGPRDMWAWRDWVINAYNTNLPFDRFTVEQIAGDLLPNATVSQKVASGFNRNHATTDEGGVIPEEFRVDYVVDRVKTVSNTWLAISLECAQCHDHKYDPVSQREYYQFYAYFNNTKDPGMQTRNGNSGPQVEIPDPEADIKRKLAREARELSFTKMNDYHQKMAKSKAFSEWLAKQTKPQEPAKPSEPKPADETKTAEAKPAEAAEVAEKKIEAPTVVAAPLAGLTHFFPFDETDKLAYVSSLGGLLSPLTEGKFAEAKREGGNGVKFAGNLAPTFDRGPELEWNQPFTFAAWMKLPKTGGGGALFVKMNNAQAFQGFDIGTEGLRPGFHLVHQWPGNALKIYTKADMKPDVWQHVVISCDGSGKAAGVKIFVDGQLQEQQVYNDSLTGTIKNGTPFRLGCRSEGAKFKGDVDDLCLFNRVLTNEEIKQAATDPITATLAVPAEQRTTEQTAMLLSQFLRQVDKSHPILVKDFAKKIEDEKKLAKGISSVMVMEDLPMKEMRATFVLNRGQYDQPVKEKKVMPGVPAVFPSLVAGAPDNRLALAEWFVRADHPLTSRVTVNRLWQMFFGDGLVRTSEDFGMQGEVPSHPEMLDWLSVDFVKSGWDTKRMIKQFVTSATYCQDSRITPAVREQDPENKLFARGPRFRLQGEFIRDNALYVSGLLVEKIGGPSVKPYQPPSIWEDVALDTNLSKFVQDHGDKLYRRSMYTYWKRSSPQPSLMIFDAPTREKCTGRRPRTNTPLQALVTLNDPQFVEAARVLAERTVKQGGASLDERIQFAIQHALSRPATEKETTLLKRLAEAQVARFQADPKKADELLKVGESPRDTTIPAIEHAAWLVVANTVLNLDEFLVKN